jgi:two-component system, sensor histidine kinase and response regulator
MNSDETALPRATVLVVDDNETNRALAASTLDDEGYRVVLADGGEAAMALFEREKPDCILLDVRMPEVDGFEVCERIRALPSGGDTPILFLTALRDIDTFDRALRAGGDDFLTKPIRPTELVVRVQNALKLGRMSVELREHYAQLKHQRDDLVRLQLQKERLMAFVVHDLKNPVNAMDLHAQLLLRDKSLNEMARDSATQIRTEARQLTRMILNLLDISKGDEGKLEANARTVDLACIIGEVHAELLANARARKIRLVSALAAESAYADEDLLRRTLANLVDNGVRHAPIGTTVTVSTRRTAGGVELRVADAGAGIAAAMRGRVFEPFVQVQEGATISDRSSRGLGLAFSKRAIEAHGGRIWVEDASPGAVFCVSLPDHD